MEKIERFEGEYRWLSNFWTVKITYEGITYNSTEAAFQASKTLNIEDRRRFSKMTAGESKKEGKKLDLRKDWDSVRLKIMEDVLRLKFQDPVLNKLLRETGTVELIEGNHWHDNFWGVCDPRIGQNHLGKLLMKIRGGTHITLD